MNVEGTQILNGWVNEWMLSEVHRGWMVTELWGKEIQVNSKSWIIRPLWSFLYKLCPFQPWTTFTFYLKPSILTIMGQCLRNFFWAWIFPASGPHLYCFHLIISFHFQFGLGHQNGSFQFLQRVPGHWLSSSLLCALQPRTRRHEPSLSIANPSEGPDLS